MNEEAAKEVRESETGYSSRRRFLHIILAGVGGVSIAAVIYPIIRYLAPLGGDDKNVVVVFDENEVMPGESKLFTYKGEPSALVNLGNGFIVTSLVCTHLGCLVKWQADKKVFLCPCHAATFSFDGKVLSGPPQSPLESIPFKISAGKITIGGEKG